VGEKTELLAEEEQTVGSEPEDVFNA